MSKQTPGARFTVCLALFVYCIGLFILALNPVETIDAAEVVVMVASTVAALGLIALAVPQITIPFENYAYLVVGFAGFTTLLLYLIDTSDSPERRTGVAMFVLVGVIGGYGAHLGFSEED